LAGRGVATGGISSTTFACRSVSTNSTHNPDVLKIAHLISKSGSRIPPRPTNKHRMQQVVHFRLRRNVTTSPHFHISFSRYFAPPCTCRRLTSTGGFLLYLTKPGPDQTKFLPAPSFVSYSRNHRRTCRSPTSETRVRAIFYETRPQSHIKFPPSLCSSIYLSNYLPIYLAVCLPTYLPIRTS